MNDIQLAGWIKKNLGPTIGNCLAASPGASLIYHEDLLGAMVQRETGFKIIRILNKDPGISVMAVSAEMKGDWSRRDGEDHSSYHGFGFWQIDIKSFPHFVDSGDWKDPEKCCGMAIDVLLGKRKYLSDKLPGIKGQELFERANVAAYNCGEGSVLRAILNHEDVDSHTYNKDYSKEVWRFRELYKAAP